MNIALILCLVTLSCQKETNDVIIISGRLNGLSVDSIYIKPQRISHSHNSYSLALEGEGRHKFRDTLNVPKGYYSLEIDEDFPHTLYLEPNFNLEIDVSDDTIFFKGLGQHENNYLADKRKLLNEIRHLSVYNYYHTLGESDFLKLLDSVSKLKLDLLRKSKIKNANFVALEKRTILVRKIHDLMGYESGRRLLTDDKDFKVSQNFPKITDLVDFDDKKLLDVTLFPVSLVLNDYYFLKDSVDFDTSSNILKCENCDPHLESLAYLGKYLKNEKVRDEVCYVLAKWRMSKTKDLNRFYKEYRSIVKNEDYLKDVKKLYTNLKESKSTHFLKYIDLSDKEDNKFKLKNFQGKWIYLDLWASYCKPCIEEFSDFNKLVDELGDENIAFVGINIWDKKERWLQMAEKHELEGLQLIADKNLGFLDSLGISGIPRYMIIDKDGKMFDYNAKRPSDPDLIAELLEVVSK